MMVCLAGLLAEIYVCVGFCLVSFAVLYCNALSYIFEIRNNHDGCKSFSSLRSVD